MVIVITRSSVARPSWDEWLAGKTLDEEQRPRSSFRPYLAPCSFRQWIFRSVLCYFSAILSRLSLYILLNSTFSFFEFLMPSVLTLSQLHWLCLWYNFLMFSSYTYNCTWEALFIHTMDFNPKSRQPKAHRYSIYFPALRMIIYLGNYLGNYQRHVSKSELVGLSNKRGYWPYQWMAQRVLLVLLLCFCTATIVPQKT